MRYLREAFPNGAVLNVVSFFKVTEARYETRGLYEEEFRRIPAVLNAADPRYELCDDCFELARNTIEGMRATADVLRKAATYKEAIDFERGENEH